MSEIQTAALPINITDTALSQLRAIKEQQNIPDDHGLRIGVKGGGCAGFSYILGFDQVKTTDTIYQLDDLKVLMEKAHGIYLLGMEIDWVEGLNNRGFSFNNPNADETCGCGTSFSA
ncbi:MAG: iron-sulfur cluster assembly accessory protein [Bacteroidota bacterium]